MKTQLLVSLILLLIVFGCGTPSNIGPAENLSIISTELKTESEEIESSTKEIKKSIEKTETETKEIKAETEKINDLTVNIIEKPDETEKAVSNIRVSSGKIEEKANLIEQERIKILKETEDIEKSNLVFNESIPQFSKIRKEIIRVVEERDKAIAKEKESSKKVFQKVMLYCFIGIGVSILICFASPKLGIAGITASAGTLFVATVFNEHLVLISWIGIAILIIIILAVALMLFLQKIKLIKKDKVIKEVSSEFGDD